MPNTPVDVMKPFREEASQRLDIFLPLSFTTLDIGTVPRRLYSGRLAVSSIILQALGSNTAKIYVSNDPGLQVNYGFSLIPGGAVSWSISLSDVLQVLGWDGMQNNIPRERTPDQWSRFRQTRLSIDASQFWAVSDAADQHLTISLSHLPRY